MGGAGLVFAEMTCVSPDARITPGCLGLWNDEQAAQWKRLVDFVHGARRAKVGIQLGHAGRKGSTRVAWEGIDQPLDDGGWPLISASALALSAAQPDAAGHDARRHGPRARRFRRRDAARGARPASIGSSSIARTAICCRASSRRSPTGATTNTAAATRTARAFRWRCSAPMRAVWPADRPMSVRLSCHDWTRGRQHCRTTRRSSPRCSRRPAPT